MWIVNPIVDLLFVCGGLLALVLVFVSTPMGVHSGTSLLVLGSVFFTATHFGAPLASDEESSKLTKLLCGRTFIAIGLMAIGLLLSFPSLLQSAVMLYVALVAFHYTGQNIAISQLYLRNSQYKRDLAVSCVMPLSMVLMTLKFFLPGVEAVEILNIIMIVVTVLALVISGTHQNKVPPLGIFPLYGLQLLLSSSNISDPIAIFFPAFVHGTQSIVLNCRVRWYAMSRAFLIGVAIAYGIPAALAWCGVNEQQAFLAVICVFSAHHFILEALTKRS